MSKTKSAPRPSVREAIDKAELAVSLYKDLAAGQETIVDAVASVDVALVRFAELAKEHRHRINKAEFRLCDVEKAIGGTQGEFDCVNFQWVPPGQPGLEDTINSTRQRLDSRIDQLSRRIVYLEQPWWRRLWSRYTEVADVAVLSTAVTAKQLARYQKSRGTE